MADVLVSKLHIVLAVLALTRAPRIWQQADFNPWPVVAWIAVCALVVFWKPAVWLLAAATLAVQVALGGNEGTVVIMWAALAVGLFEGRDLLTALRALTSVIYLFAAAHKMFSPFLSGAILASASWLPLPQLVSPSVVIAEAVLGVLVWRRSRLALPAAIILHSGIVFLMNWDWDTTMSWGMIPLAGFNLMMVGMVWLTTRYSPRDSRVPRPRRRPDTCLRLGANSLME